MLSQACGLFVAEKSSPALCVRCGWDLAGHVVRPVAPPRVRSMKGWRDTIRQDVCRNPRCRQLIYFIQNVRTLRFVPFNGRPRPLGAEKEIGTDREAWILDLATVHVCTDARGRRGGRR